MAIRVRIPRGKAFLGRFDSPITRALLAFVLIMGALVTVVIGVFFIKYQNLIDRRMSVPIFANTAKIYAAPKVLRVTERIDRLELTSYLRRAGYSEEGERGESRMGTYRILADGISISPGPESYHRADPVHIAINNGTVENIVARSQEGSVSSYELEPVLFTGLFDQPQRSKRRLVSFDDIPKVLVDAITSIEDRRFFQHGGVNYVRLAKATVANLRAGRRAQGGSTLTMQIARGFFLTREKIYSRKLTEIIIALELENKFSKKRIFELYANQVNMGQRGSFSIDGLGEAASSYFGKDIKNINLPEAALLAGLIQRPSYFSPYRHPDKALARRNLVLDTMVETGSITAEQAETAKASPLKLAPLNVEASDAPYFVDLVRDSLLPSMNETELNEQGYRIYTSLVPELQRAAAQAVESGMQNIDGQVAALHNKVVKRKKGSKLPLPPPPVSPAQVAMVVLDPHTGKVLALVGGRNYGMSQLNHAVAKRPTGSIFKPFVYAAALNTGLNGSGTVLTPTTILQDEPQSFANGGNTYQPRNYHEAYHGMVTARYALAHSLNNPTVQLAEMVGYGRVAALAHAAGLSSVRPTPAMALGSYDATPLEMAGAYTVFANSGTRISPLLVSSVRDEHGEIVQQFRTDNSEVLDPRVAYVLTTMMQGVLETGTGATVRARGFSAPAAGKTGTSHDAWFAGYTSNLLAIVWVGNDDYSDLKLSGATTAAPIWADFMKRAILMPGYQDARAFTQPPGVVGVQLDRVTNRLPTASCPQTYTAAFIAGTEPKETCEQVNLNEEQKGFFSKIFGLGKPAPPVLEGDNAQEVDGDDGRSSPSQPGDGISGKKKGFFGSILGIFRKEKPKKSSPAPPPPVESTDQKEEDPPQ